MSLSSLEMDAAQLCSVTEVTPKSTVLMYELKALAGIIFVPGKSYLEKCEPSLSQLLKQR